MERIVLASAEDVKQVSKVYDAVNDYFDKHENYFSIRNIKRYPGLSRFRMKAL